LVLHSYLHSLLIGCIWGLVKGLSLPPRLKKIKYQCFSGSCQW